jgi:hypothetical protein
MRKLIYSNMFANENLSVNLEMYMEQIDSAGFTAAQEISLKHIKISEVRTRNTFISGLDHSRSIYRISLQK